jgi:ankyrin repeat protein
MQAAYQGRPKSVELLICDHGARVNHVTDGSKNSPLLCALGVNRPNATEVTRILLDNGADMFVADDDGWTVLHYATLMDSGIQHL